jgi:hypothetical protein
MASSSAAILLPEYADGHDGEDLRELTPTPSRPAARLPSRPQLTLARGTGPSPAPPRAAAEPTLRRRLDDQTVRIVELLRAGLSPVAVSMILRHELGLPSYYTLPHIRAMAPEHRAMPRGRQLGDDDDGSGPGR